MRHFWTQTKCAGKYIFLRITLSFLSSLRGTLTTGYRENTRLRYSEGNKEKRFERLERVERSELFYNIWEDCLRQLLEGRGAQSLPSINYVRKFTSSTLLTKKVYYNNPNEEESRKSRRIDCQQFESTKRRGWQCIYGTICFLFFFSQKQAEERL